MNKHKWKNGEAFNDFIKPVKLDLRPIQVFVIEAMENEPYTGHSHIVGVANSYDDALRMVNEYSGEHFTTEDVKESLGVEYYSNDEYLFYIREMEINKI